MGLLRSVKNMVGGTSPAAPQVAAQAVPKGESRLETPDGWVRVVHARGKDPVTKVYPERPALGIALPADAEKLRTPGRAEGRFLPTDASFMYTDPRPKTWPWPASLDNPNVRHLAALKRLYADPLAFPSSMSPDCGLLIHALVRNMRPRVIVETGTYIGASAVWMASALEEVGAPGVVHCFDNFTPVVKDQWCEGELKSGRAQVVAGYVASAGVAERVVLHPGNSWFEIPLYADDLGGGGGSGGGGERAGGVDLALLDADHTIEGVVRDFQAVEGLVNIGGFVLLHDTYPEMCGHAGPRWLIDNLGVVARGRYERVELYLGPVNYGLAVLRRIG